MGVASLTEDSKAEIEYKTALFTNDNGHITLS